MAVKVLIFKMLITSKLIDLATWNKNISLQSNIFLVSLKKEKITYKALTFWKDLNI